jgi:hypothetical protein
MVFSATFNNISVISGRSVLLVGKLEYTGENHRPVARTGFELTTLEVIDTDYTGSYVEVLRGPGSTSLCYYPLRPRPWYNG